MQYNYNSDLDEFVENPSGKETDQDITGNRAWIVTETLAGVPRFKVEIDDFGCVIAAFNRLVQRLIPTFRFPESK